MKIAYFDCFSGISGNMVLGALLDAGLPFDLLQTELVKLGLENYKIETTKVDKLGIAATYVHIHSDEKGIIRYWSNIEGIIEKSRLEQPVKKKSKEIFLKLAGAEAKIHRKSLDQVHFHEIGAVDSIVDIVGAAIGFHHLEIDEVFASPLATGMGMVKTEHGTFPVPAPATLEILKDVPVYSGGIPAELVTPTGAAIIKAFAQEFGEMPLMKIQSIGYGAGTRDLEIPNVLRLVIGDSAEVHQIGSDGVELVESNIDDMNPEFYSHVIDKLFKSGALDVWITPIFMKKSRPAVNLSLLVPLDKEEKVLETLFSETSTLGTRIFKAMRKKVEQDIITVKTKYGQARVKVGRFKGKIVTVSPEYEDCAALASKADKPVKIVYDEIKNAAEKMLKSSRS